MPPHNNIILLYKISIKLYRFSAIIFMVINMSKVYDNVAQIVGNTPMLKLNNFNNTNANIFAKLEYLNPAGSVKDRVAKEIILDGINKGIINKDTIIYEPTSGNTGIGLAAIGASLGLKVVIILPDTMSVERRNLIKAYGASLVLTEGALGMKGAIDKAEALHKENPNSIIAGQFVNPVNPQAHYNTTAPEIYNDLDGNIDIFVAGIGTGGTITGVAKYLKEKNPNVMIVGVEPQSSPLITKGVAGAHKLQGIGANFIPEILDLSLVDEIIAISNEDAYNTGREIAKKEGILVGISAGAALYAATILGNRKENNNKNIVVLLPDTGDRYLSVEGYLD